MIKYAALMGKITRKAIQFIIIHAITTYITIMILWIAVWAVYMSATILPWPNFCPETTVRIITQ